MPIQELNDDAIDLQELQAQIDLSMSFAQNLVTSWVRPAHFAQPTKQSDLENELKEHMRRPARLGVGAPIPETQSLAREATRLRSKLEGGKKRHREEETTEIKQPQSESEEESRAGAIKKKARVDPFNVAGKKKKKKKAEGNGKNTPALHPAAFKAMSHSDSTKEDGQEAKVSIGEPLGIPEPPEVHKKKKKRHLGHGKEPQNQVRACSFKPAPPNIKTTSTEIWEDPSSPKALNAPRTPTISSALPSQSSPTSLTPTQPKIVDVSLTTTPVLSPGRPISDPKFLKQPLLNPPGSPSGGESEKDEKPDQHDLTPKKKRKRKKKRKKQSVESVTEV